MVLLIGSTGICSELTNNQKKILKAYPSWSKKQKIKYFDELAYYLSKDCPDKWAKKMILLSVKPGVEEPGLRHIIKLSDRKTDYTQKKWNDIFKEMKIMTEKNLCNNPSYFFFMKLKGVYLVYEYYDKELTFLKKISVNLDKCLEK